MTIRIVSLLVFASILCVSGNAQLRQIYQSTEPQNDVRGLSFYSPAEGYVAYSNWVGYTTDSGRSYSRKFITSSNIDWNGYSPWNGNGFWTRGVKAFGKDTILVYGQLDDHAAILRSTNGGNSFKLVFYSWYKAYIKNFIAAIDFARGDHVGYAIDGDRLLKTTNRGIGWSIAAVEPDAELVNLQVISNNEVFAVGRSFVYRTTNGAGPFSKIAVPGGTLAHASFLNTSKGWASLGSDIYYTSDAGVTWSKKNLMPRPLYKLKFINDSTGYAITDGYDLMKTTDSGKVWEPVPRDNNFSGGYGHTELYFLTNYQFWAGGEAGFLEITLNGGGPVLPRGYFSIDTAGVHLSNTVRLSSLSKPNYTHKWFRNGVLIGTGYTVSYMHGPYDALDSILLVVINGSRTDTGVQLQRFNALPAPAVPTINSFTPVTGPTGTEITITGTNFTGANSVKVGGVEASSFIIVSSHIIRAVVADSSTGAVVVTTPIGTASRPGFTWYIPFAIRFFSPLAGPAGTQVTIKGNLFNTVPANNIVYFGGVKANVLAATDSSLLVAAPAGAGYEPISVTTNGRTAYSKLPYTLTFAGGRSLTAETFAFRTDINSGWSDWILSTGDFDMDGKPDIITSPMGSENKLSIFRNKSTLNNVTFDPVHFIPLASWITEFPTVVRGDLNGDGKLDIVSADGRYSNFSVITNTSSGGNLSFSPWSHFPGYYPYSFQFAGIMDFEGDGKPDIFGTHGGRMAVYQNNSTGSGLSFSNVTFNLYSGQGGDCAAADLDGDGKPDLVSHGKLHMRLYRNTSNGGKISFTNQYTLPTEVQNYPGRLAISDLDGDGKPDLIIKGNSNLVSVFRNTSRPGQIIFEAREDFLLPSQIVRFAIGDLNGDGKPDVAATISDFSTDIDQDITISLLENTSTPGNISFAEKVDIHMDPFLHSIRHIAISDIDSDGKNDIVCTDNELNAISVFLNQQGVNAVRICQAGATTLNAGNNGSSYQWQQNISGTFTDISNGGNFSGSNSQALQISNVPAAWNGRQYRCLVDGNVSRLYRLVVDTFARPGVTVATKNLSVCENSPVTFTSSASNSGKNPHYEWQINNVPVGADSSSFTSKALRNNDQVRVIITGSKSCQLPLTDTSNVLTMNVGNITVVPKVRIEASDTAVCQNAVVMLRAVAENGGDDPQYNWRTLIFPAPGSTDSSIYTTFNLGTTETFFLVMVSNAACASPAEVISNSVTIHVESRQYSTVFVTASNEKICTGAPVTFTAATTFAGDNPLFDWRHNEVAVANGSNSYTPASVANGDNIMAYLTSSALCVNSIYATSNRIKMEVSAPVTPTISLTGNTAVDPGQSTRLTANFTGGGTTPSLQWQDSTINHSWINIAGANNLTLDYSPGGNVSKVRCILETSAACASPSTISSVPLTITVNMPTGIDPAPASDYGIRFGPNPVSGFFIIDSLKLSDKWESLEIISVDGRKCLPSHVISNLVKVFVPAQNLQSGMYVAVLKRRNGRSAFYKFVKL